MESHTKSRLESDFRKLMRRAERHVGGVSLRIMERRNKSNNPEVDPSTKVEIYETLERMLDAPGRVEKAVSDLKRKIVDLEAEPPKEIATHFTKRMRNSHNTEENDWVKVEVYEQIERLLKCGGAVGWAVPNLLQEAEQLRAENVQLKVDYENARKSPVALRESREEVRTILGATKGEHTTEAARRVVGALKVLLGEAEVY